MQEALKNYLKAIKTDSAGPTPMQRTVTPLQSPVPANDYDRLYSCSWSRKMTLLIYLLFLNIAANVLYTFPYSQNTRLLTMSANAIAIDYLRWLSIDIAVIWIFAIAALHWPVWKYYFSSSNGHGPDQKTLIELMLPHQEIVYFTTSKKTKGGKKWYILVFLGLSTSVIFSLFSKAAQ